MSVKYTWTTTEVAFLKTCATLIDDSDKMKWNKICAEVNTRFHNCRTASSCQRRHRLMLMRERTGYDKTGYDKTGMQGKR